LGRFHDGQKKLVVKKTQTFMVQFLFRRSQFSASVRSCLEFQNQNYVTSGRSWHNWVTSGSSRQN